MLVVVSEVAASSAEERPTDDLGVSRPLRQSANILNRFEGAFVIDGRRFQTTITWYFELNNPMIVETAVHRGNFNRKECSESRNEIFVVRSANVRDRIFHQPLSQSVGQGRAETESLCCPVHRDIYFKSGRVIVVKMEVPHRLFDLDGNTILGNSQDGRDSVCFNDFCRS